MQQHQTGSTVASAGGSEEEQHLQQLAAAGSGDAEVARQAVQRDLERHFVSGGQQLEGERRRRRRSAAVRLRQAPPSSPLDATTCPTD